MAGMNNHVCMNILYKDLSDPGFKEFYTLDEINEELMGYEGGAIEPLDMYGQILTDVKFHMSYRSFLFTIDRLIETTEKESVTNRIHRYIDMAIVK